jgi:hypothetical protein
MVLAWKDENAAGVVADAPGRWQRYAGPTVDQQHLRCCRRLAPLRCDAAIQTLQGEHAEFGFGHVEPTAVLGIAHGRP